MSNIKNQFEFFDIENCNQHRIINFRTGHLIEYLSFFITNFHLIVISYTTIKTFNGALAMFNTKALCFNSYKFLMK